MTVGRGAAVLPSGRCFVHFVPAVITSPRIVRKQKALKTSQHHIKVESRPDFFLVGIVVVSFRAKKTLRELFGILEDCQKLKGVMRKWRVVCFRFCVSAKKTGESQRNARDAKILEGLSYCNDLIKYKDESYHL